MTAHTNATEKKLDLGNLWLNLSERSRVWDDVLARPKTLWTEPRIIRRMHMPKPYLSFQPIIQRPAAAEGPAEVYVKFR